MGRRHSGQRDALGGTGCRQRGQRSTLKSSGLSWSAASMSWGQYTTVRGGDNTSTGYNRRVRLISTFLLIFGFAGCHRGVESKDAVRQGVLDYLATKGLAAAAMDINVTDVKFDGDKADATVSFAAKGTGAGQMAIQYRLELKDSKWAVVGRKDASQHGGGQLPPGAAPQGSAAQQGSRAHEVSNALVRQGQESGERLLGQIEGDRAPALNVRLCLPVHAQPAVHAPCLPPQRRLAQEPPLQR